LRFTVGKKLWAGFLSVVLILVIVGAVSFLALKDVSNKYQFLIDDRLHKVVLLEQQLKTQNQIASDIRGFMLYENKAYLEDLERAHIDFFERLDVLEKMLTAEATKQDVLELREAANQYDEVLSNIVKEYEAGNKQKGLAVATSGAVYQDV